MHMMVVFETVNELWDAVHNGAAHIRIQQHLDLTTLVKGLGKETILRSGKEAILHLPETVKSIRVHHYLSWLC